jgi:hypothetical protein
MPDENPFENQPVDHERRRRARPAAPATAEPLSAPQSVPPAVDPFEGRASWETPRPGRSPARVTAKPALPVLAVVSDNRTLALGAGFGLIWVGILFYVSVGLVAGWRGDAIAFAVTGTLLSGLTPYFFMHEHLTCWKPPFAPVRAKLLAGALFALQIALTFALFLSYGSAPLTAVAVLAVPLVAWLSLALLLFSLYYQAPP